MRFQTFSIFVDDQQRALEFYTGTLGFAVKDDIPIGADRWLTIVSPDAPEAIEVLLEPKGHPAVGPFTARLVADRVPWCTLEVDDVGAAFERLTAAGVAFVQPPTDLGPVVVAVLDDTVGNLIQLARRTD